MPADLDTLTATLHETLQKAEAADEFSGVLHLGRGGETVFTAAYGLASRRWGIPNRTSTRFDVASITKLFTTVAVFQQVEAGTLSLDDRITEVVDLAGTTISPDITLRHLLTHTSGLTDDADEEDDEDYAALWVDRPNYSVTETADFLPQFAYLPPRTTPGEVCRYNNVGFILAGLALEKATGSSFRDYVREHVFPRAGMTSSGFFDMRDDEPDVAEGWDPVKDEAGTTTGWQRNIYSYPPIGSPDGGAHCTAADLVRFLDAVRAHQMVGEELSTLLLTPQVLHHRSSKEGGADLHYGFGLEFEIRPDGSTRSISKEGANAGVSAFLAYYPDADLTAAWVANGEDWVWGPAKLLDGLVAD